MDDTVLAKAPGVGRSKDTSLATDPLFDAMRAEDNEGGGGGGIGSGGSGDMALQLPLYQTLVALTKHMGLRALFTGRQPDRKVIASEVYQYLLSQSSTASMTDQEVAAQAEILIYRGCLAPADGTNRAFANEREPWVFSELTKRRGLANRLKMRKKGPAGTTKASLAPMAAASSSSSSSSSSSTSPTLRSPASPPLRRSASPGERPRGLNKPAGSAVNRSGDASSFSSPSSSSSSSSPASSSRESSNKPSKPSVVKQFWDLLLVTPALQHLVAFPFLVLGSWVVGSPTVFVCLAVVACVHWYTQSLAVRRERAEEFNELIQDDLDFGLSCLHPDKHFFNFLVQSIWKNLIPEQMPGIVATLNEKLVKVAEQVENLNAVTIERVRLGSMAPHIHTLVPVNRADDCMEFDVRLAHYASHESKVVLAVTYRGLRVNVRVTSLAFAVNLNVVVHWNQRNPGRSVIDFSLNRRPFVQLSLGATQMKIDAIVPGLANIACRKIEDALVEQLHKPKFFRFSLTPDAPRPSEPVHSLRLSPSPEDPAVLSPLPVGYTITDMPKPCFLAAGRELSMRNPLPITNLAFQIDGPLTCIDDWQWECEFSAQPVGRSKFSLRSTILPPKIQLFTQRQPGAAPLIDVVLIVASDKVEIPEGFVVAEQLRSQGSQAGRDRSLPFSQDRRYLLCFRLDEHVPPPQPVPPIPQPPPQLQLPITTRPRSVRTTNLVPPQRTSTSTSPAARSPSPSRFVKEATIRELAGHLLREDGVSFRRPLQPSNSCLEAPF